MSWTPESLASGWWNADALIAANDDPVSIWPGLGADLTVPSDSQRPTFKTNQINGLPALEFDGVDDWIRATSTIPTAGSLATACVYRISAHKDYGSLVNCHSTATPTYFSTFQTSLLYANARSLTGKLNPSNQYVFRNAGSLMWEAKIACLHPVFFQHRVNSTAVHTSNTSISSYDATSGDFYLSFGNAGLSNSYFQGLVAEIVAWDATIASEHLWVEGYLAHKYALPIPSSHPFADGPPTSGPSVGSGERPRFSSPYARVS